jgi:hypothetical protein
MDMRHGYGQDIVARERRSTGQTLVGEGAERVDVRRRGEWPLRGLFRRHVPRRAKDVAHARQPIGRGGMGDSEIHQDDPTLAIDEDIARLDVPVDDAGRMSGVECVGRLRHD